MDTKTCTVCDKEIESLLKKYIPNFKINNASSRTDKEVGKILRICYTVPNLIVFLVRTNENSSIFKYCEKEKNLNHDINLLFFNKDNYLYFEHNTKENCENIIRFVKQYVEDEIKCIVCYENFDEDIIKLRICEKCGASTCKKCVFNMYYANDMKKVECPVCREPIIIIQN